MREPGDALAPPSGLLYRAITPEEFPAFCHAAEAAFGWDPPDEKEIERERGVFEYDRSLAAFDGATIIATSNLYSMSLRIPGGDVACPVVSYVTVTRANRRRGLLGGLMRGLLDDARDRDEPLVALFASESTIYGRFGFGIASQEGTVRIDRRFSAFRPGTQTGGRVRSVDAARARELFPPVYAAVRRGFAGMPTRTPAWWEHLILSDPKRARFGYGPRDFAVHEEDGAVDGYVISRVKPDWKEALPDGTIEVLELFGTTPEALAGLWRYCLDADLCEHLVANRRHRQEPLQYLLVDPRRLQRSLVDGLWLRFVDLPAALGARAWAGSDRLVLDIADPFLPGSGGTWALEVIEGKATCTRSSAQPDLELDTEGLASCYLGDTRPPSLLAAGRLQERTAGAARRLDELLGLTEPPWAPQEF